MTSRWRIRQVGSGPHRAPSPRASKSRRTCRTTPRSWRPSPSRPSSSTTAGTSSCPTAPTRSSSAASARTRPPCRATTSCGSCSSTRTPPRSSASTSPAGACRCSPTSPPPSSGTARTAACSPSAGTSPRTPSWTPPTSTACRTGSVRSAPAAVEHDGAVRPVLHPDPRWGRTDCRVVGETPKTLQDMGYRRMTLVLREARRPAVTPHGRPHGVRRPANHLRVVPAPEG